MKSNRLKPTIADFILVAILAIAPLIVVILSHFIPADSNAIAEIRVDGAVVGHLSLDSTDKSMQLDDGTIICVDKDGVYVAQSVCKDGLCENMGHIRKNGQTIVCLPQKIIIQIISSDAEVDAYAG